jgi:hypothetical protein
MSQPRNGTLFTLDFMLSRLERRGALVPGSKDRVVATVYPLVETPDRAARGLIEYLSSPQGSRFVEPGVFDAGSGRERMERVLELLPVAKSKHQEMMQRHGPDMAMIDLGRSAEFAPRSYRTMRTAHGTSTHCRNRTTSGERRRSWTRSRHGFDPKSKSISLQRNSARHRRH